MTKIMMWFPEEQIFVQETISINEPLTLEVRGCPGLVMWKESRSAQAESLVAAYDVKEKSSFKF